MISTERFLKALLSKIFLVFKPALYCYEVPKYSHISFLVDQKDKTMSQEEFQKQVLNALAELKADSVELRTDVEKSNDKFEVYRQATQSVVNLAFGLIASVTVITVISSVFKR
jgi:hypothetical protein